jgi:hypothetical protein
MKKNILLLILFFSTITNECYKRTFCNYGTVPAKIRVHFTLCGDKEEEVAQAGPKGPTCYSFDSGGCCVTSVDLSAGGYPHKNFPLDNFELPNTVTRVPLLHRFRSTGLNMSCEESLFGFWNDPDHKILSSYGSVANDYPKK